MLMKTRQDSSEFTILGMFVRILRIRKTLRCLELQYVSYPQSHTF